MKSPLTSGFFQKIASTHHSSLMMPVWGLLQWKIAQKNTYKHSILTRHSLSCRSSKQIAPKVGDVTKKLEPLMYSNSSNLHERPLFWMPKFDWFFTALITVKKIIQDSVTKGLIFLVVMTISNNTIEKTSLLVSISYILVIPVGWHLL